MVLLVCSATVSPCGAQPPAAHYRYQGLEPPGAIGSWQLQRGGPLSGYPQPVEIKAPQGALISLASEGKFCPAENAPTKVGLLIGAVYRLRVTNIPLHPGREVFPTIEVIDRLYPPPGQALRFPIPIELTQEELELALDGKFITRVVYLENPQNALPVATRRDELPWFDAGPGSNPLEIADRLGRPVAIVRLGGRLPDERTGPDQQFLYGSPPYMTWSKPQGAKSEGESAVPDAKPNRPTKPFVPSAAPTTATAAARGSASGDPLPPRGERPPVAGHIAIRATYLDEADGDGGPAETPISDKQPQRAGGKLR